MRRLMLAFAVTAALGLAVAAPAVAAPEQNPLALNLTVTCGSDTFDAIGVGRPGWLLEAPEGTTPGLLMGGTHTITVGGQEVYSETFAPPSGLVDKLEMCRIERSFEPDGLSVWYPAYIFWPAQ